MSEATGEGRLRLFFAVPAPPGVKERASEAMDRLRGAGDVRWVQPEKLHVTLKFLGDTDSAVVEELAAAVQKKSNKISRFVVKSGSPGAFPNARRPRTLWLGIEDAAGGLAKLAKTVEDAAAELGFAREERPFQPHLTLGRVKSSKGAADLSGKLLRLQAEWSGAVEWPVSGFTLYRSELRPGGPSYTALREFPLSEG